MQGMKLKTPLILELYHLLSNKTLLPSKIFQPLTQNLGYDQQQHLC